jgi:hypothetical protein
MAALRKRYRPTTAAAPQPNPQAPVSAPAPAADKPAPIAAEQPVAAPVAAQSHDEPASIKERLEALRLGEEKLRRQYEEQARLEIAAQFAKPQPQQPQPQQPQQPPQQAAEIESLPGEIDFEQRHGGREALAADMPRVHRALRAALAAGPRGSDQYFQTLESEYSRLKAQPQPHQAQHEEPPPRQQRPAQPEPQFATEEMDDEPLPAAPVQHTGPVVSAPVTREAISFSDGKPSDSKVVLTAMEREAARFSGVEETEYARQKMRLLQLQKQGFYNDR